MDKIRYVSKCGLLIAHYFASKLRLTKPPNRAAYIRAVGYVCGMFLGWNKYIRVRGREHVPVDHPCIVFGNHILFDDPFYAYEAARIASNDVVNLNAMTRDDFFVGTPFKTFLFDADDFITYVGTYGINRDKPTLSQMKLFLGLLADGQSFIMYPGRTRSRSGLLMEYRDNFQEPGGPSFFLNSHMKRNPDIPISALPTMRNYNPVRKHTSIIFGPQQFLDPGSSRDEQRAFELKLIEVMSQYVEISVPQIISVILYSRCLHSVTESVTTEWLTDKVKQFIETTEYPWLDEEDLGDVDEAVQLSLPFFEKHDMIAMSGNEVTPISGAILFTPELEDFFKKNPVKYMVNQLLHLADVLERIEELALTFSVQKEA
jgi:1-acyl-sn-glycerol-3-phosphate acyltransferase